MATASRIDQLAGAPFARGMGDKLRSDAVTIRQAAMEIRNALAGHSGRARHPKFGLIVGDESEKQEAS